MSISKTNDAHLYPAGDGLQGVFSLSVHVLVCYITRFVKMVNTISQRMWDSYD